MYVFRWLEVRISRENPPLTRLTAGANKNEQKEDENHHPCVFAWRRLRLEKSEMDVRVEFLEEAVNDGWRDERMQRRMKEERK